MNDRPGRPGATSLRAREAKLEDLDRELAQFLAMGPLELRRAAKKLRRVGNKVGWRVSMQRYTSLVSAALRAAELALGDRFAGRAKVDHGWTLFATGDDGEVPALQVVGNKPTRWEDFSEPVVVRVLERDLVDVDLLARSLRRTNSRSMSSQKKRRPAEHARARAAEHIGTS